MKTLAEINEFEKNYKLIIPNQYKKFLKKNNGFSFEGGKILYSLEELKEMNDVLQVQKYQCNYIAIGDDGGGLVFLMEQDTGAEEVICVDMSDYNIESNYCRISSFTEWYSRGCNIFDNELENNKLSKLGSVYLVKMPNSGVKGLIKIKQIFNIEIPTSKLLTLSKTLPCLLKRDIKYAKAIKLMEKIGQNDIFEFQENP